VERSRSLAGLLAASCLAMVLLANLAAFRYSEPYPPLSASLSSPMDRLSDFAGIAFGFRRLTADVAWVQTLVYYGSEDVGADSETAEQRGGQYTQFLAYCQRVAGIDPYFTQIFYYGAGVLGWNLNRLDEAEELLKEGIQFQPKQWRFQQFLAALAYQKNHNINKLVEFLEGFIEEKDCPNMLRSILANIYKKQKRYLDAMKVWTIVYQTQDPIYLKRAISQIEELYPLAKQMGVKAH
jgi:tetratricopeptide (TPR) repeat protein